MGKNLTLDQNKKISMMKEELPTQTPLKLKSLMEKTLKLDRYKKISMMKKELPTQTHLRLKSLMKKKLNVMIFNKNKCDMCKIAKLSKVLNFSAQPK